MKLNEGATGVITHRVRDGQHGAYENWLKEIVPVCQSAPGYLDWHVVRPIPQRTQTFTVIIRFETTENLKKWLSSPERARLIAKVQPLLVVGENLAVNSGLDFLFSTGGAKGPVRWKQFLVTWSAIFPLGFVVSKAMKPLLQRWAFFSHPLVTSFVVSGIVVFLMVYVIMPRYTKLIKRWLFNG